MIEYIYGDNLGESPILAKSMFRDRGIQFHDRLKWDVSVNEFGEERDQYDQLNPLYVIISARDGSHEGSMRFLPTTGRTMINEHFSGMLGGVRIESPTIWECTRFCISPRATRRTTARLLVAGAKLMKESHIAYSVAVFDNRMERTYALIGASPTVLCREQNTQSGFAIGLWEFDQASYSKMLGRSGYSAAEVNECYLNSWPRSKETVRKPRNVRRIVSAGGIKELSSRNGMPQVS